MKQWEEAEKQAEKKMLKISGEAKRGGGRKALIKIKDVAKWFLKKVGAI